jgi:polar amino acid transport system substrate-binding protein
MELPDSLTEPAANTSDATRGRPRKEVVLAALKCLRKAPFWIFILLAAIFRLTGPTAVAQDETQPVTASLRVVTKPIEPFVMIRNGELSGFSIEIWEAIASDQGWDFQWTEVETVTEQLDSVRDGQADAAIAGISMTPEREQVIDFSHPYFTAGLQILTPEVSSASLRSILTTIFSPTLLKVLAIGLVTLIIMAHLIWVVERGNNSAIPNEYLPGIWEASWWALSTIATLEYGDKEKPTPPFKRLLAMILVVMGIILIAQFTAAVTASLTVQQLTGTIRGPSDLPGKRIATVQGSTSARYLDGEGLKYIPVTRIDEAYQMLEAGEIDAVVYDAPVIQYYALHQGKGLGQVVGPLFQEETYGIALPSGSTLREDINESLLRLKQDGVYDTIYTKWFGNGQ